MVSKFSFVPCKRNDDDDVNRIGDRLLSNKDDRSIALATENKQNKLNIRYDMKFGYPIESKYSSSRIESM